ncbi:hypothetical protein JRO89_XS13G0133200 [Xanthoceras sorbifolium]|uniref:Beta-amylase n=1 Tax=Xanthoceras sorbifolium TaxID=99658 RepID=A0ABQ8H854_9ROSI|nr:hypothetical protein JRO89_XS13G0133200 [Xanthoceras sorbifolium]
MAIATFSTSSFCCTRPEPIRLTRFFPSTHYSHSRRFPSRVSICARLNSSNSVYPADSNNDDNRKYELHDGTSMQSRRSGSPVFVKLPVDSTWAGGKVRRRKAMAQSFKALAAAGVEGVVVEVWWGMVERESPGVYDWRGYVDLIAMAGNCGLKVRALFAFHQCGIGPGDPKCITLCNFIEILKCSDASLKISWPQLKLLGFVYGILSCSLLIQEFRSCNQLLGAMIKSSSQFYCAYYCSCFSSLGLDQKIPLPLWVLEEIDRDPDLAYSDRFGRRNMEYISLGCDILPVLRGRSPIQAYTDLMRNFRDTFRPFLGVIITGVQIGMGPAGELRYPSCPSQKLTWAWRSHELGEFQCYDKYMLASLNACAREIGMREWGNGGPIGAGNLMQDPEHTEFFRSDDGSWNTAYGSFFLQWYSGMLLLHGERICREAEKIFGSTKVNTSAKVGGIHWHYGTQSHPSELTAGYFNTSTRDGYLPIARMFGRYGFSMCCTCFEMRDADEKPMNPLSSPEGFLRQLLLAARVCDIPLEGENSATSLDDTAFQQVIKMSKFYSDGLEKPSFSFNFVRMDKNMFEYNNWVRFTRFVRQMSDSNIFRSKLDIRSGIRLSSASDAARVGMAFAHC